MQGNPNRRLQDLLDLQIDRERGNISQQIFEHIRLNILSGQFKLGDQLPSSRALMQQLECSRTPVLRAFDQLIAEGYLESTPGSGTRVAANLPLDMLDSRHARASTQPLEGRGSNRFSRRGEAFEHRGRSLYDLRTATFSEDYPDLAIFPFDKWSRIANRLWRRPRQSMVRDRDPKGYLPLRRALASYLSLQRGMACTPEQVIITAGATHALDIVSRLLLDRGDGVWIEDPGYRGFRILSASGAELEPVAVDSHGLRIDVGRQRCPRARMAVATPSYQFPLGCVMSIDRRIQLLDWAHEANAWVLEDDYNCEFRYVGSPLSSIQSLDLEGRVIYLGTFSKIMFPSIRLGYIVASEESADRIAAARHFLDVQTAVPLQPVLAEFIEEGHFMAHIRRARRLYHQRQLSLVACINKHAGDLLEIAPSDGGMHLLAEFKGELAQRIEDVDASDALSQVGIAARPISECYFEQTPRKGLILGYAAVSEDDMEPAVALMARVLRKLTTAL